MKILIILSLLSYFSKSFSKLNFVGNEFGSLRYSISSCVLLATKEQFDDNVIITISLTIKDYLNYSTSSVVTDQILLRSFHQQLKWTFLVKKSSKPKHHAKFQKKTDEYVIQIRDLDEFDFVLNALVKTNSWNPHAKFIIITTTRFPNHETVTEFIFELLWKQKVLNVVIMLPISKYEDTLNIYTWFPFRDGQCGERFDKAVIINQCKKGSFVNQRMIFPEKIPKNMKGCPVKVRTIIWPPYILEPKNFDESNLDQINFTRGIEIKLLNTVAEAANFKLVYSVSHIQQDWGEIYYNGTATGMMKTILNEEANIGIGAIAAANSRHRFFDYSISYIWESVTWCIPHAMPIPKWKSLLKIFSPTVWIILFVTYVIISLTVWQLSNLEKNESYSYKSFQGSFQNMLCMLLGITTKVVPKVFKIRLIIIIWMITSVNLNTAYKSTLIRELTKPSFEKQIKNMQEMVENDYAFGLVPPTGRFFNFKDKFYSESRSWSSCDDVKVCLDRSAYKRDFAVGVPRMYMQYVAHKYVTTKGLRLLYWSKEDIAAYPVEMIMTKGFPLLNRINNLTSRITEAGLIAKWAYDFLEKIDNVTVPVNYENDDADEIILTKFHLEGAFILLNLGLTISLVIFICEIVINKRKRK